MKNKWTGERLETFIHGETTIEHLHRYALAMDIAKGKKVLDIACGEGYGANLLAVNATAVIAVDIDSDTIAKAKIKYQKTNLQFYTGSVENIPCADNEFDLVISFETIEHITGHEKMVAEIKRVLKPEGLLIISTPDKKNYTDKTGFSNPYHLKELYKDEFIALLSRYFKNVQPCHQQIAQCSVITNEAAKNLVFYSGDYQAIKKYSATEGLYCIAIASNAMLPEAMNSLFNGQIILEKALLEKEKSIKNSASYKLGHAILYPAKLIRKVLKK